MTTQPDARALSLSGAGVMLAGGALILALSLGIRHGFGLYLQPVSMANGWGREVFGFAIALQNLVWGFAQPFSGMLADRFGAMRVVFAGALMYSAGLALMAMPLGAPGFVFAAGILVGLGLSGVTMPVIFGAISRAVAPEKRSLAMGITMAVGSFGQFAILPVVLWLMSEIGWSASLLVLAGLAILMVPAGIAMTGDRPGAMAELSGPGDAGEALREAGGCRDFWLLSLGFFVCGFQVVFIGVHLPAYLADGGLPPGVATLVLALIGLVNIAGAYLAGLWGGSRSKPGLLVWIYLARGLLIAGFVLLPLTEWSALSFGALMGLFWLSTVPLTNGIIAGVFGVKYLSMLGGIAFLSHQVGSFLGGWLGGYIYDRAGSYDPVWWIAVALSLLAAVLNVPVREDPISARSAAA